VGYGSEFVSMANRLMEDARRRIQNGDTPTPEYGGERFPMLARSAPFFVESTNGFAATGHYEEATTMYGDTALSDTYL
jgi:hypothetical protein